jgi:hypothetical protein
MHKLGIIIAVVLAVLMVVASAIFICPFQLGRFTTDASRSIAISPEKGLIEIIEGTPNGLDALHQDLLFLLVVCPNIQTHGEGSGMKMDTFVTTFNYSWGANPGAISIQVRWNRQTDKILIGDQKFIREKGNVFVVERETSGKIIGYQLSSLGSHAGFQEVLDHVQREMPNDKVISSLKLYAK